MLYMGKRKDNLIKLRVEAGEKEGFQSAAGLAGLALSAWIRERLRKIAGLELKKAGQNIPFLPSSRTKTRIKNE
jgi:hypothetical protein